MAAGAAELWQDDNDEGRLRCVQDAGVLFQKLLPFGRPSLLSGRLQPQRLLSWFRPQPEQPTWR